MTEREQSSAEPSIERFLDRPPHDLSEWEWLWKEDHAFPIRSHRSGLLGRVVVFWKRLLRPLVRVPQNDLWQRQNVFNRVLIDHLRELQAVAQEVDVLGRELQQVQREILRDLREVQSDINSNVKRLSNNLDDFRRQGMVDLMHHTDALFARLDQRLDRLQRRTAEIGSRLPGGNSENR